MSTFDGLVAEVPGISVDQFDKKNLESSIYFLSHCHTDHMVGLDNNFFKHLKDHDKSLYCSKISKTILQAKYTNFYTDSCVKHIDIDERQYLRYKHKNNVEVLHVTCISADHCPGSVMFLFEKNDKLILYTGDFRIDPRNYKDIKSLHVYPYNVGNIPKKLTKIYLDTTFLDHNYTILPTRKESMRAICKETTKWLEENSKNVVVLECSASYGYESLYIELSKALKQPIHVKDSVHSSYCKIPELADHITDKSEARIHACTKKSDRSGIKCCTVPEKNILTIVPSVLQWKNKDTSVIGEWNNARERTYNVCYSTHASYDELEKFILYFKPEEIYPCVCPQEQPKRYLLHEIQSKYRKKENKIENCEKYQLQILKQIEIINKRWTKYYFKCDENYS